MKSLLLKLKEKLQTNRQSSYPVQYVRPFESHIGGNQYSSAFLPVQGSSLYLNAFPGVRLQYQ